MFEPGSVRKAAWRSPVVLLILMSIAMPIAFHTWTALLNNFAVERASFTGVEIGILQSLREIPGFIAFTTVFVLLVLKEQTFADFFVGAAWRRRRNHRILPHRVWLVLYDGRDVAGFSLL